MGRGILSSYRKGETVFIDKTRATHSCLQAKIWFFRENFGNSLAIAIQQYLTRMIRDVCVAEEGGGGG